MNGEREPNLTVRVCGPSAAKCKCNCPESCEHQWDGPWVEIGEGGHSVTCSRCGMSAMAHGMWVLP